MIKYSVKRKRKHSVKPKKEILTEYPSFSSSVSNNDIGRLVWGKVPGSRIWPGIIVDHRTCGMPSPSEKSLWIFWFGDQRLSLGTKTNTYDFFTFFKRFYSFRNSPTTFKKGIFSILVECRKRAGLSVEENQQKFTEYEKWAQEGFTNPSKSFDIFLPSKGMSLPAKVLKQLSRIKLIQEESKNHQETWDHFLISSSENDSDTESLKIVKRKAKLLKEVRDGVVSLESVCLGCERVDEQETLTPHPVFQGSLCQHCMDELDTSTNGIGDLFCTVCCRPGEMFVCDHGNCNKIFCLGCVELFVAPRAIKRIRNTDPWSCFLCAKYDPDTHGLLVPREEWLKQMNL